MKDPVQLFRDAENFVRANGFAREVDWCEKRPTIDQMTAKDILREYAWVVFNSGMRNSVIEAKWRALCEAFRFFNLKPILDEPDRVRRDALNIFGHYKKVDAVIEMAKKLWNNTIQFREEVKENVLVTLEKLAFIGNVTKYHLARNLGFDVIKPDRHLQRLAARYGMTPFELCNQVHKETGRRLGTIDVVFWRFSEQRGQTKLRC